MLVLSRKCQEAVVVNGPENECVVKVTVLDIRGGQVRLGFQADSDVAVHRWEVWERIRADEREEKQSKFSGPAP